MSEYINVNNNNNVGAENTNNKRKFSLVIHPDTSSAAAASAASAATTASYDIPHPSNVPEEMVRGRKPLTGNLMMLKQANEVPSIRIRSMSCPIFVTSAPAAQQVPKRKTSVEEHGKRLSLKEVYNSRYVENLKKDLMDFYHQQADHHLEEEVIEEEPRFVEEEDPADSHYNDVEDSELLKENEISSRVLSSCISRRSGTLTPPVEVESECEEASPATITDPHDLLPIDEMYYNSTAATPSQQEVVEGEGIISSKSSMSSIYTTHSINTEGRHCSRHHHRRPSCAIKFEEPQVMEWQRLDPAHPEEAAQQGHGVDESKSIFKENYTLQPSFV